MDDAQILDIINSFDRWHYQIELLRHKTRIFATDHINRHEQRRDYFFSVIGRTEWRFVSYNDGVKGGLEAWKEPLWRNC